MLQTRHSKDRWVRCMTSQSPLTHYGLDSSPQFFLLSKCCGSLSSETMRNVYKGDDRAQGDQDPQPLTLAPETGPGHKQLCKASLT